MEPKFRTSFIPKESLSTTPARTASRSSGGMGIITLAMLVLFLASIALSVGVFLYQQYLEQSIESKSASLARAQAAFDPALLEELSRLNDRLDASEELLERHVAPSALFDLLEESTLERIQFTSFSYSVIEPDQITISMKGEADSFNAVALQSDIFGESRFIKEPIFSDLNLDQVGNVVFNFSAVIDPGLLAYGNTLQRRAQQAQQPVQQQSTSTQESAPSDDILFN